MSHAVARKLRTDWRIADATHLGDHEWALTLLGGAWGELDATAVVRWRMDRGEELLDISACTDESARAWLATCDGEHAAYRARIGRFS
jgi:hypothetical protein